MTATTASSENRRDRMVNGRVAAQLLVSVRSEAELESVIESGADIVDLKEPKAGPLAPTDPALWEWAKNRRKSMDRFDSPKFSAALGEPDEAIACAARLPGEFDFAKAGPSGCDDRDQLWRLWEQVRRRLDDRVELVAVAYADFQVAGCPAPETVFRVAAEFGLRHCLLDTYRKDGRSSIEQLGMESLRRLAETAERQSLWWALAGSIRRTDPRRLQQNGITPNCFGVRGDVCAGAREDALQPERVHAWRLELEA
jgi:uncharacterized protein (UPF0264 family)